MPNVSSDAVAAAERSHKATLTSYGLRPFQLAFSDHNIDGQLWPQVPAVRHYLPVVTLLVPPSNFGMLETQ